MFLAVCECVSTPNPDAVRTSVPPLHLRRTTWAACPSFPAEFSSRRRWSVRSGGRPRATSIKLPQRVQTAAMHAARRQFCCTEWSRARPKSDSTVRKQYPLQQSQRKTQFREKQDNIALKQGALCGTSTDDPLAEKEFRFWQCHDVLGITELLRNKEIWMKHLLKIKVGSKTLAPKARLLSFSQ